MTEKEPIQDYRLYVRRELNRRAELNPRYSLRALAKDLQVSQGYLSMVLNRKRALNEEMAFAWSQKLGFPANDVKQFLSLVRLENSANDQHKAWIAKEIKGPSPILSKMRQISADEFRKISGWIYRAILGCFYLENPPKLALGFARRLRIDEQQAEKALENLSGLGLVTYDKEKQSWVLVEGSIAIGDWPSEDIIKQHEDLLALAAKAIREQNRSERDFTSSILSLPAHKLALATQKIREFHGEMLSLFDGEKGHDAVYNLSLQLFRLDKEPIN